MGKVFTRLIEKGLIQRAMWAPWSHYLFIPQGLTSHTRRNDQSVFRKMKLASRLSIEVGKAVGYWSSWSDVEELLVSEKHLDHRLGRQVHRSLSLNIYLQLYFLWSPLGKLLGKVSKFSLCLGMGLGHWKWSWWGLVYHSSAKGQLSDDENVIFWTVTAWSGAYMNYMYQPVCLYQIGYWFNWRSSFYSLGLVGA